MSNPTGNHHRKNHQQKNELREIEVLIISAQNLKNVKHVTEMKTYALVYVDKDVHVAKTQVDDQGGTNPTWSEIVKVKFPDYLPETDVMAALNVDIYSHGRVREKHVREKPVGSARVLLSDVLKGGRPDEPADNPITCMTVQVWRPSGRSQGLLNLWVPPTGRFLMRRDSLSFNVRGADGEKKVDGEGDVDGGATGGGGGDGGFAS